MSPFFILFSGGASQHNKHGRHSSAKCRLKPLYRLEFSSGCITISSGDAGAEDELSRDVTSRLCLFCCICHVQNCRELESSNSWKSSGLSLWSATTPGNSNFLENLPGFPTRLVQLLFLDSRKGPAHRAQSCRRGPSASARSAGFSRASSGS